MNQKERLIYQAAAGMISRQPDKWEHVTNAIKIAEFLYGEVKKRGYTEDD